MNRELVVSVEIRLERTPGGHGVMHFRVNGEVLSSCHVEAELMPDMERRLVRQFERKDTPRREAR